MKASRVAGGRESLDRAAKTRYEEAQEKDKHRDTENTEGHGEELF